jgi:predicted DCC family thiol-disulfide oxidoreductase YuxK
MNQRPLNNVVFFDGACALCNRFVDYLIRADKKQEFKYAPLQGVTFATLSSDFIGILPDSVVFYSDHTFSVKSTAALKILIRLGGWYRLLNVFFIVPAFIRDAIYDFIAKNRFNWFGKKETCRLPSLEERSLFLD